MATDTVTPQRPKVETSYVFPPIPLRQFDWVAHSIGAEPGDIFGWGRTECEAIGDFWEQWEESHPLEQARRNLICLDEDAEIFVEPSAALLGIE